MPLLTQEESGQALKAIGATLPDLVAADVVRLYKCPQNSSSWQYTGVCGAAMFVIEKQDNVPVIKIVDMKTKALAFEQECYPGFELTQLTSFFYSFEGDDGVYGLNFAEEAEPAAYAQKMKMILTSLASAGDSSPKPKASSPQPAKKAEPAASGSGGGLFSRIFGSKKKEPAPQSRPDRSKIQISGVKTVVHVSHIGFTEGQGFQLRDIPAEWKHIFAEAGVTEADLQDKKTAEFLMKTIATVSAPPPPPPPPAASSSGGKTAPPPPPSGVKAPPPPPPPSGGPPAPPPPSSGPPAHTRSVNGGSGGVDLLDMIKTTNLKKVTAEDVPEVSKMSADQKTDLAANIRKAMEARRTAVNSDGEESEDEWD